MVVKDQEDRRRRSGRRGSGWSEDWGQGEGRVSRGKEGGQEQEVWMRRGLGGKDGGGDG